MIFDSPMDIGLVVLVALILFGGKKVPELMRELGKGIRDLKNRGGKSDGGPDEGSPQHPIPVTGPIETKRNSQSKKKTNDS